MSKILTMDFILEKANNNNPKNISVLNLWGNQLSDISILSEFPSLEIISLSSNQIKDISVFKKLKNVRELYLKDNIISDINQIENLKNCQNLEKLILKDNPIANIINYKQKILETLPQLKKLDDIDVKQLKLNNNNYNSPLVKKDSNQSQNSNYNIQSPNVSKNNISIKSGSESISSERKGEAKNDSAAPHPISENLNINNINNNNDYNSINSKLNNNHNIAKSDLLNRSFKKKITEGSFGKVLKKKNNMNININQEEKKKLLLKRSINDNKNRDERFSQTISGFYKNQFKKANENGGYKKKIIGNFKQQEQEHKDKNKHNIRNTVFKKYQYFDNDKEHEEEKKKSNDNLKSDIFIQRNNQLMALMSSNKKNSSLEKNIINNVNNLELNKNEIIIKENDKDENINKSVIESIKLLMTTLSFEGLTQIYNDIQKLIEEKNKH